MNGEPIQALNNGFNGLISMLRADPQAMDSLHLSVITFDREVKILYPLIESGKFYPMEITCPDSGPTHTGAALEMVSELVQRNCKRICRCKRRLAAVTVYIYGWKTFGYSEVQADDHCDQRDGIWGYRRMCSRPESR